MAKPAARPGKHSAPKGHRYSKLWAAATATWSQSLSKVSSSWREKVHGAGSDAPRVIVRADWRATLGKCSIHVVPVLATCALAFLNIKSYFIGANLHGFTGDVAQDIDRLCLQVTAKLFVSANSKAVVFRAELLQELFVVSSLGVILVDAIRDKLLFGEEGVPLGLALANFRFGDARYLFTRDFLAGCSGFKRWMTRILFAALILVCCIIGLFVGPASAVLIIPQYYESWPAGGASFWADGDLFPAVLHVSDDMKDRCDPAFNGTLSTVDDSTTSCPWAGYHQLKAEFTQRTLSVEHSLSYNVDTFRQSLAIDWDFRPAFIHKHTARVWVTASNIAIASLSRFISQVSWTSALWAAKETQTGGYFSSLQYRDRGETTAVVRSKMPLVRAQCLLVDDWMAPCAVGNGSIRSFPFPMLPDKAGIDDYAFCVVANTTAGPSTSASWVPLPKNASLTSYGALSSAYPSAFLLIERPSLPFSASDITCSVQALWVEGKTVTSNVAWSYVQATESRGEFSSAVKRAIEAWGGSNWRSFATPPAPTQPPPWQPINLTMDWLSLLTPDIDAQQTGRTSLAALLESVINASTYTGFTRLGPDEGESNMFIKIGTVVASFVADGTSRLGWTENELHSLTSSVVYNDFPGALQGWNWQSRDWDEVNSRLIRGTATLVPNAQRSSGSPYDLVVKVKGYGLRAASTAYWLSLAVLFAHLFLVIGHVAYTIYRRRVSSAWSSLTDLVVLSQLSQPAVDELRHCSTGVRTHAVLRKQLRIRTVAGSSAGAEQLQLVVAKDTGGKVDFQQAYD